MNIQFSSRGWEDDASLGSSSSKKILKRINELLKEISSNPYEGTGKPEPLKHALSGFWSRRITDEHRLVYRVESDAVKVAQARYRYE